MLDRLDWALTNDAWILTFPQCLVSHFPRVKFDHKPILLKINPTFYTAIGRPFRFLAGWTKHANFPSFVKDKWNFSSIMAHSLSEFTSHVKKWNRFIYGIIVTHKRNLMKSLLNIQGALDRSSSSRLMQLESEVRDELENLLDYEELLWKQKARCDWVQFGDRIIKFFHIRTI